MTKNRKRKRRDVPSGTSRRLDFRGTILYMKHISPVFSIIIIGLVVGYVLTDFVFIGDWTYLFIVPSLFGIAVVLAQKGNRSIDFLKYLAIGSMLFGVFMPALHYGKMWYLYSEKMSMTFDMMITQSVMPTVFYFTTVSFIAGLLAIVARGFWGMRK